MGLKQCYNATDNERKHKGVSFHEAAAVFGYPLAISLRRVSKRYEFSAVTAFSIANSYWINLMNLRRPSLNQRLALLPIIIYSYSLKMKTLYNMRMIASNKKQAITLARELTERCHEVGSEGLDFIETILFYKLPYLSREEIRTMPDLNDIELKQTCFYQYQETDRE